MLIQEYLQYVVNQADLINLEAGNNKQGISEKHQQINNRKSSCWLMKGKHSN